LTEKKNILAIGLLSGGLDSSLALRIIQDQGVDVRALTFHTGFCFADTRRADRRKDKSRPLHQGPADAKQAIGDREIPLEVVDISDGYLQVLHHPVHGYGANVNPCIDCRIHMFTLAKWYLEQWGADFIFTGEVLGQRPMSQHFRQLMLIAQRSGLEGRLLRPLSAKLLPETIPEREGWVDRNKLLDFHGRSRKPQMALAEQLGLDSYPQPAGGCCYLTDPEYGKRVKELWDHTEDKDNLRWNDYILLKTGRQFRLPSGLKIIMGRDEGENLFLEQYAKEMIRIEPETVKGPVTVIEPAADEGRIRDAARVTASYCKQPESGTAVVMNVISGDFTRQITVEPYAREEIAAWQIN